MHIENKVMNYIFFVESQYEMLNYEQLMLNFEQSIVQFLHLSFYRLYYEDINFLLRWHVFWNCYLSCLNLIMQFSIVFKGGTT